MRRCSREVHTRGCSLHLFLQMADKSCMLFALLVEPVLQLMITSYVCDLELLRLYRFPKMRLVIPAFPFLALMCFLLSQIISYGWLLTISTMALLAGEAAFLLEIKIKLLLENSLGSRTQNAFWYHEKSLSFLSRSACS